MANDIKDKVKSLYEIMKDEKIEELEVNSKDYKLRIKRKNPDKTKPHVFSPSAKVPETVEITLQNRQPKHEPPSGLGETIKSPITGVFYKSPSPSSPVFVKEGDTVETGKTLCIVEAMKVMNEIKATFKVKIIKILVENGKPVNSGQDLFEVEKV
ncbi:MAG: acetyl-CoA carboxylase biotin carboxyl carrier protein [Endomicrobium sp.]|jgi:acetyl-CoA carboxylase biotin carboxyl carrier protein|nr:acetyl-CoA carboxylase biotin carboxyl carrier protein [Endomicrobium sp.]